MIQEREQIGAFLTTFTFFFNRMGLSQARFAEYTNAQPVPDDLKDDPRYRHLLPLSQTTISRIFSGSIPDENTLYRIARIGFGLSKGACCQLEDLRWEAYLFAQEGKQRTTQQLTVIPNKPKQSREVESDELFSKVPSWVSPK